MSKKKKKFKKKISQNLHERLARIEIEEKVPTPVATPADPVAKISASEVVVENKYAYVKKDIKRDFLIILGLLVILTTVVILNQKTSYLTNLADWIYKTLNLSV